MKTYLLLLVLIIVSGCISSQVDIPPPVKDVCAGLTQIECNKNPACTCKFGTEGDGVRIAGMTFTGCVLIGEKENDLKKNKTTCMQLGGYYLNKEMGRGYCLYSNSTDDIKTKYFENGTGGNTRITINSVDYSIGGYGIVFTSELKASVNSGRTLIDFNKTIVVISTNSSQIKYSFGGREKRCRNFNDYSPKYYIISQNITIDESVITLEDGSLIDTCLTYPNFDKDLEITFIYPEGEPDTQKIDVIELANKTVCSTDTDCTAGSSCCERKNCVNAKWFEWLRKEKCLGTSLCVESSDVNPNCACKNNQCVIVEKDTS
jgi:hypothetical protein